MPLLAQIPNTVIVAGFPLLLFAAPVQFLRWLLERLVPTSRSRPGSVPFTSRPPPVTSGWSAGHVTWPVVTPTVSSLGTALFLDTYLSGVEPAPSAGEATCSTPISAAAQAVTVTSKERTDPFERMATEYPPFVGLARI